MDTLFCAIYKSVSGNNSRILEIVLELWNWATSQKSLLFDKWDLSLEIMKVDQSDTTMNLDTSIREKFTKILSDFC